MTEQPPSSCEYSNTGGMLPPARRRRRRTCVPSSRRQPKFALSGAGTARGRSPPSRSARRRRSEICEPSGENENRHGLRRPIAATPACRRRRRRRSRAACRAACRDPGRGSRDRRRSRRHPCRRRACRRARTGRCRRCDSSTAGRPQARSSPAPGRHRETRPRACCPRRWWTRAWSSSTMVDPGAGVDEVDQPYRITTANVPLAPTACLPRHGQRRIRRRPGEPRAQDRGDAARQAPSIPSTTADGSGGDRPAQPVGSRSPPDGSQILIGDVGGRVGGDRPRAVPAPGQRELRLAPARGHAPFRRRRRGAGWGIPPVFEYSHEDGGLLGHGWSRDRRRCTCSATTARASTGCWSATRRRRSTSTSRPPCSFGRDGAGNLLVASGDGGVGGLARTEPSHSRAISCGYGAGSDPNSGRSGV